ncbi:MAG: RNA polymerase subunit sigma, partial [Oscillospiraceae bacterium]|nr:RNA polymerase subunit sigma [Oscillospiraceae bacterium]
MDKELTLQELEARADALLAAAAEVEEIPIPTTRSKRSSKKEEEAHAEKKYSIDDKVVAKLPAAALITANEKLRDLFAKGKHTNKLSSAELMDVLDEMELESEQLDRIYDSLESLGIDIGSHEAMEVSDDEEPSLESIGEIEEEELVDPNELVDNFSIDDPVRMYLKEIGKVPLLSADEEVTLATTMAAKLAAEEEIARCEETGESIPEEKMSEFKKAIADGEVAKQKLAEANLRLVVSIA